MEHKHICDLTPIEFEKYCYDFLNGYAQKEGLQDFKITHNTKLKAWSIAFGRAPKPH